MFLRWPGRPGSSRMSSSSFSIGAAKERVQAMPDAAEEVLAFPDTQARQLAGVSMRRLRYWEEVGLVVPSIRGIARQGPTGGQV
jgi:MerR HTH family regulatory protein